MKGFIILAILVLLAAAVFSIGIVGAFIMLNENNDKENENGNHQ